MLKIGCHLSIEKGYAEMGNLAASIGCNTLQCFSRNPIGISSKPIEKNDSTEFKRILRANRFSKIIIHAPYIINPCSKDPELRMLTSKIFSEDLISIEEHFPNNFYNIHPGNHEGQGEEIGIKQTIDFLNKNISPFQTTTILIETMSGKESEIGKNFEEIKDILDGVTHKNKVGICLNTCHVFAAGYDIANNLNSVLSEFDKLIGLNKLYAIHLNDSIEKLGSHKDKHQILGSGNIGLEAIIKIINHKDLKDLPFILETPNDIDGYEKEIEITKANYK